MIQVLGFKCFLHHLRNLQAAIGAYYDFESPNINVPSMSFVEDVTIGEGESIPPDTQFTKTWRIQNTGTEAWPPGVCLKYVGGDQFGHVNMVMVRSLEPQEISDVSVQMCSPSTAGMYQGQWRMCTATGLYYGDVIWVILSVEVGGLLGVTQQLSSFETEFNTQPHRKVEGNFNPFASPQKNRQPDENNLKDPGGSELGTISKNTWGPAPDQIEQDQNGLSQNSVNLSPSSHSNNLSVVTYSKVWTKLVQDPVEDLKAPTGEQLLYRFVVLNRITVEIKNVTKKKFVTDFDAKHPKSVAEVLLLQPHCLLFKRRSCWCFWNGGGGFGVCGFIHLLRCLMPCAFI
ncbi:protein ILRUN isoform X2 [Malaclemys terrapin pileata]|uniref:protein ILRUN isoform X2 n=1 Tax=Malaclemys terrapin pileata TaxID=2991368 RepID=UPI0023A7E920|nr:protein ILRUN isoform X2 [Malaclemys terrapin pileata]